jgi:catechol 2,3-dioxygenase-like lactoylglutathione lyase family enzyme
MSHRPPITQQVTFLYTNDLPATHQFYAEVLGLPLVLDQGMCRIYQVQPTAFLGFCQAGTAVDRKVEDPSGIVLTLVSDHVDAWHDYLTQHHPHVVIEKPPTHNPTYNIYHLFLRDPNQYLVEIQTFLDPTWPR